MSVLQIFCTKRKFLWRMQQSFSDYS